MKLLDAGAMGIICPMINNADDAKKFIGATKYPPTGYRSTGPTRAVLIHGNDYHQEANDTIISLAMVETVEALNNVDEIAETEGLSGIYIGPSDLALALGLMPGTTEPEHEETIKTILAAAKKHGIAAGIHTGSVNQSRKYLDMGFHMVTLGTDRHFMERMAKSDLAAVRGGSDKEGDSDSTGDKLY